MSDAFLADTFRL